nr:hypothetical protein [Lachnospiraceae bacterium]
LTRITLEIEYPENASNEQIGLIDSALREAMSGYRCSYASDMPIHIDPFTEAVILFDVPYSDKEQGVRYITDKVYRLAREMSVNKIIEISKPKCLPKSLWAGRYLIVTHTFNDHSELNPHTNSLVYRYIPNGIFCTIQNNHLVFTEMPQIALTEEESKQITKELKQIRDRFNESIKSIKPKSSTITLDDLNS